MEDTNVNYTEYKPTDLRDMDIPVKVFRLLYNDMGIKNIGDLQKHSVAEYLNTAKPQSHMRNHKFTLLEYLTDLKSLSENKNVTEIDFLLLKKDKLNSITHFVNIKIPLLGKP